MESVGIENNANRRLPVLAIIIGILSILYSIQYFFIGIVLFRPSGIPMIRSIISLIEFVLLLVYGILLLKKKRQTIQVVMLIYIVFIIHLILYIIYPINPSFVSKTIISFIFISGIFGAVLYYNIKLIKSMKLK